MKAKLSLLYFFQFSVWGCYLTCFGQLLGAGGLGRYIAWFYAAIGIVSIISPPLLGRLADQTGRPARLLGACHLGAGMIMISMWYYGLTHEHLSFNLFYPLYLGFLLLYMPTMALANTTSFSLLAQRNLSPVTTFPKIRIWGTVGFVAAMWFVNSAYWQNGNLGFTFSDASDPGRLRFQYNVMQLLCSGIMGIVTSTYVFATLPQNSLKFQVNHKSINFGINRWYSTVKEFLKDRELRTFLIFVALTGVCLQISNGFATPYITHFSGIPEYADSLASGNATMLFSLSQISEALCILFVGFSLKYKGIKWVYGIGILAWSIRFFLLGTGNPGSGLWMLIGSMLVYGLAFNFITIAGHIYIQQIADENNKGFAQGIMMLMSNGIGATTGTLVAGGIINHWCSWQIVTLPGNGMKTSLFMGEWIWPWLIFACYALFVLMVWIFRSHLSNKLKKSVRLFLRCRGSAK